MADATSPYGGRRVIFAASQQKGETQGASVGEKGAPCGKMDAKARAGTFFSTGRLNLAHRGGRNMQRYTTFSRAGDVRGAYAE